MGRGDQRKSGRNLRLVLVGAGPAVAAQSLAGSDPLSSLLFAALADGPGLLSIQLDLLLSFVVVVPLLVILDIANLEWLLFRVTCAKTNESNASDSTLQATQWVMSQ